MGKRPVTVGRYVTEKVVGTMCGIVGLYLKNPKLKSKLGRMFKPMIIEMTNRGPDSAGVAIYRNPVKKAETKF